MAASALLLTASLARTKHVFSLLNGALVFFGAAIGIMGVYLWSDPHLSEMHGENDIGYVCWGVMSLGAALLVTAAFGCKLIVTQGRAEVRCFCLVLSVIVVVQLYYEWTLRSMFMSNDVAQCAHADVDGTASTQSALAACRRFASSHTWTGAYAVWQQLWAEGMKALPDSSAQSVLQQVQDSGRCCGFGDRSQCRADPTPFVWLAGAPREPRQRCAHAAPNEYCFSVAQGGTYASHCSIKTEWDFAYGTFDGCIEANQRSGRGCAAVFALFINRRVRVALDWAWVVLLFEIAIGICAARLLLALAEADRECVVGSGSHAHSYQTVPSNGGGGSVASGSTLSI